MICKNCENIFEGNYCNQCGQKKIESRFNIKEIIHNFFHSFTHLESGILFLAKELYIRPGIVAKEYIEGKRKKYFNPFQYLILLVAISMFLAYNFDLFGPKPDPSKLSSLNGGVRFGALMNSFYYKYYNLILFFSVPVYAFFSMIFFRKSVYNYSENLIFNTFISAQRSLTLILLTPFLILTNTYNVWYVGIGTYYIFWIIYFIYAYRQFFGESKLATSLKFIGIFILVYALSQILVIGIVYFFLFK